MEGQRRDPRREAEASCGVGEIRHATAIRVTIGDVVGGAAIIRYAMMHHRAEKFLGIADITSGWSD